MKITWESDNISNLQSGFNEDRRITDNLYTLKYNINQSYKMKKEPIVTSLDLKKAFDSIDKKTLITALMNYEVHPKIINLVANIYRWPH